MPLEKCEKFFMFKLYSLLYICINEYKSQFVTRKYIYILFINHKFIPNEIKYLIVYMSPQNQDENKNIEIIKYQ